MFRLQIYSMGIGPIGIHSSELLSFSFDVWGWNTDTDILIGGRIHILYGQGLFMTI